MKQFISMCALAFLISCGGAENSESKGKDSTGAAATPPEQPAQSGGDFYDVSKWKTLDLKEFNSPFSISVPEVATANKSLNNDKGTQVQFGLTPIFYEIAEEEGYATPAEVITAEKSSWSTSVKDFKVEKEDADGIIFSYTEEGKTCRGFVLTRKESGKIYSIDLMGSSFDPTPEQIEKLYNGAKAK